MNYQKLLERGMEKVPKKTDAADRFKVPDAQVFISGARTNIANFIEIANYLRRPPDHLLKFLLKELATSGDLIGTKVICQGRFPPDHVNKKIETYIKIYVICPECGKPDTKLIKEGEFSFIKCEACGAKHVVKKI